MGLAGLDSLWDIRVGTIINVGGTVVMISGAVFLVGAVLVWLVRLGTLTLDYHARGYPWPRVFRLALADLEKKREQRGFTERVLPTRFSASPAQRKAWAQELEEERRFFS
jgi:hypothetical protein